MKLTKTIYIEVLIPETGTGDCKWMVYGVSFNVSLRAEAFITEHDSAGLHLATRVKQPTIEREGADGLHRMCYKIDHWG